MENLASRHLWHFTARMTCAKSSFYYIIISFPLGAQCLLISQTARNNKSEFLLSYSLYVKTYFLCIINTAPFFMFWLMTYCLTKFVTRVQTLRPLCSFWAILKKKQKKQKTRDIYLSRCEGGVGRRPPRTCLSRALLSRARADRPQTSWRPPVISLLAVPRLLFCFSSLVILDVACCYLWLFSLYINIKIGKNSC